MVNGWLLLGVLLGLYGLGLFLLHRKGLLGPGKPFELVMGPLLMWRTEQGKKLIDRVSRPRRFWMAFGDVGVVLCYFAGVLVLGLLILQVYLVFTQTDLVRRAAPSPEYFLVLPGINPLIPVGYGILALAIALIVHEGAHGVLARAHGIKVKSLGLLTLVVPIGAFVEPDDEEMERASTRVKNRVFSAGVMSNLMVAVLAGVLFSSLFWTSAQPAHEGLPILSVVEGEAADQAGIAPGMFLVSVNGTAVRTLEDYNRSIREQPANASVVLGLWDQGRDLEVEAQLTDRYAYYERVAPALNNETFRGQGFLGVSVTTRATLDFIRDRTAHPLSYGLQGFGLYISLPFQGLNPLPATYEHLYMATGPLGALPAPLFWMSANTLYWIFWLNLMVGSFNALPAGPLDGGQMFRASVRGLLRRRLGVTRDQLVVERPLPGQPVLVRGADDATQAKMDRVDILSRRITLSLGLFILGLILINVLGPMLLR